MRSRAAKRAFYLLAIILLFGGLVILSQSLTSPDLSARLETDIGSTQTAIQRLTETPTPLATLDPNLLFATPISTVPGVGTVSSSVTSATATPGTVEPSRTPDPAKVIEFFSVQTLIATSPFDFRWSSTGTALAFTVFDSPARQTSEAIGTQFALTNTAVVRQFFLTNTALATQFPTSLFVTQLPALDAFASRPPNSMDRTLTAQAGWVTAQVLVIQATAQQDIATIAADMAATATARPTATPTATFVLPTTATVAGGTAPPENLPTFFLDALERIGSREIAGRLLLYSLLWVLPGLITVLVVRRQRKLYEGESSQQSDLPSFVSFYAVGVGCTFLFDILSPAYYFADWFPSGSASIDDLFLFAIVLGIFSIVSVPLMMEMAKGFDLLEAYGRLRLWIQERRRDFPKAIPRREFFLYGPGFVAFLEFIPLLLGGPNSEYIWLYVFLAYVYLYFISQKRPQDGREVWSGILNTILLPVVGLLRLTGWLVTVSVVPDAQRPGWGLVWSKLILALLLTIDRWDAFTAYLGTDFRSGSGNFGEWLFLLPALLVTRLHLGLESLVTSVLNVDLQSVDTWVVSSLWIAAWSLALVTIIWLAESIAAVLTRIRGESAKSKGLSPLAKSAVDIFVSWGIVISIIERDWYFSNQTLYDLVDGTGQTWFFYILVAVMLFWTWSYLRRTLRREPGEVQEKNWLRASLDFLAALASGPLLATRKILSNIIRWLGLGSLAVLLVLISVLGSFPALLRSWESTFSVDLIDKWSSVVQTYDIWLVLFANNLPAILVISFLLAGWLALGLVLRANYLAGTTDLLSASKVYLRLVVENLLWITLSIAAAFLLFRFINPVLLMLPAPWLETVWLRVVYYVAALFLFVTILSRLVRRRYKNPLRTYAVNPLYWLVGTDESSKRPTYSFAGMRALWEGTLALQSELSRILRFLFLPYPFNRGRTEVSIPNRGQRKLKYTSLLGEGFYLPQALLIAFLLWLLSGFSPFFAAALFSLIGLSWLVFTVWFLTKSGYSHNTLRNYRILLRLTGAAVLAACLAWLIGYFVVPVGYVLRFPTALAANDLGLLSGWVISNPPFPYFAPIVFLSMYAALSRKTLQLMWGPNLSSLRQPLAKNLRPALEDGRRTRMLLDEVIDLIRVPTGLAADLSKSKFFIRGLIFYLMTIALILSAAALGHSPTREDYAPILLDLFRSYKALLLAMPFVAFISAHPKAYLRHYYRLVVGILEWLIRTRNFNFLPSFVPRSILFNGYRKAFQYVILCFFFAHGFSSFVFETIRVFLTRSSAFDSFVLILEFTFTIVAGSMLAANYVRIIPVVTMVNAGLLVGFAYFSNSTASLYYLGAAVVIFVLGLMDSAASASSRIPFLLSPRLLWQSIRTGLFHLDFHESLSSKFSDLIRFDWRTNSFEIRNIEENLIAELKASGHLMVNSQVAAHAIETDPLYQILVLYAVSAPAEFRAFSYRFLFSPDELDKDLSALPVYDFVKRMILPLYMYSLEHTEDILNAVTLFQRNETDEQFNLSRIHVSEILPLPFEKDRKIVLDFAPRVREAIAVYLDNAQDVEEVAAVWSNLRDESDLAKNLCHLYDVLIGMKRVNKLDEIAIYAVSLQELTIPDTPVLLDYDQIFALLRNVAEIIASARIQRPRHRSHEYSFALKQLQVIRSIHLPILSGREKENLTKIVELWSNLITEALIFEPALPQLNTFIEATQLESGSKETLILVIENVGESSALEVKITLVPSPDLKIVSPAESFVVDEILGRSSIRSEFDVLLDRQQDANISIEVMYQDVWQKQYTLPAVNSVIRYKLPSDEIQPFDQSIANPYVYGPAVVDPDHFFGREKTLQAIEQRLRDINQVHIMMLYGQRRMGKSSILKKVQNRSTQLEEWWPIYLDGATIFADGVPEIMLALALRIWSRLPSGHGLSEPALESFRIDPGYTLVSEFLPAVDAVIKENGKALLILFDEFDTFIRTAQSKLKDAELQQVLWVIREFAQAMMTGGFIYAGTFELLDLSRYYKAPLFNLAEQIKVGPLDETASRDLISVPASKYLQFNEDAVQKIMRLSGRHPYFIQLLCNKIFDEAVNENTHFVGVRLVNSALAEAQEQENAFFSIWAERTKDQKLVLSALAQVIEFEGFVMPTTRVQNVLELGFVSIAIDRIQNAIDRLVEEEILVKDNDLYGFSVDLLRGWIKSRKSLPSVRAEIGYRPELRRE